MDTKERNSQMQADRNAGMSVPGVAKKYGVSTAVVYGYTKMAAGTDRPYKKAAIVPKAKAAIVRSNGKTNGHTSVGNLMAANQLLDKWNAEADAVFAALPLEKKAELLASLG